MNTEGVEKMNTEGVEKMNTEGGETMVEFDFSASDTTYFRLDGVQYRAQIVADLHFRAPWIEEDGHGPVSEWTTRPKAPGERILAQDRQSRRYYDIAEATRIAKRDSWDAFPHTPVSRGQKARRAVEADFQRLKAWCDDQWFWVGVIITARCTCCDEYTGPSSSLWGIESDSESYLAEVAGELAEDLSAGLRSKRYRHGTGVE